MPSLGRVSNAKVGTSRCSCLNASETILGVIWSPTYRKDVSKLKAEEIPWDINWVCVERHSVGGLNCITTRTPGIGGCLVDVMISTNPKTLEDNAIE